MKPTPLLAPSNSPQSPARSKRRRKKLIALAVILILPVLAHFIIGWTTKIHPPSIAPVQGEPEMVGSGQHAIRRLGKGYARKRGNILEVRLAGTPEEIGHQHGRILYPEMVANEGTLYEQFNRYVPFAPARWLLVDLSRLRYREIDRGIPEERRREIAAQSRAFSPDPFDGFLETYHRFTFLQSLYDISLSFEHSPLLGCTSFALSGGASENGHTVLARNFDFEAGSVFDEGKAVFLVHEEGRIPYASVAWPGLVGAVSGINAEGLALVVHGARAKEPQTQGEPVVHTMRELLGRAANVEEAIAIIASKTPMVSHLVMLADAKGRIAVAERAPGAPLFIRENKGAQKVALTNHFEGPLESDPENKIIEAVTSTRPRRLRLDELLANLPPGASVQALVNMLRDRKSVGSVDLPLGHRRAIDALIATHGVVMDTTGRVLWVSEGPHLLGRFIRFDLKTLLDPAYSPGADEPVQAIAEDPILNSGEYEAWKKAGSPHGGERK